MKIALISDIHGNAIALNEVFNDIKLNNVDKVFCLGDVATLGPNPHEVIAMLMELGCPCILGNHDEFILDPELIHRYTEFPVIVDSVDWCRQLLKADEIDFLRSFKGNIRLPLGEKEELYLFHGSPRSHMEDILATTPAEKLDEYLEGNKAKVMACGHTHLQMLRQHRGMLIVNPGSTGLPFLEYAAGGPPIIMPHAEYAIINDEKGKISVELRQLPLDKRSLADSCRIEGFPLGQMLAEGYEK